MQKVFSKSLAMVLVAASTFVARAADKDPVVARYHFVGTSQLTAANYNDIRKILTRPTSVDYRDLVLNRFSAQFARSISATAAAVRPMFDDLLAYESAGVFGVPGAEPEAFAIAVRLPNDRANAWKQILGKSSNNVNGLHVRQEGEWLVVARGTALKSAEDKFTADIQKNHRPVPALKDTVLEANIDWPRLQALPVVAQLPFKPAVLQVKVSPKGNNLRTEVHARYPEAITWTSQPWRLPTETIRDPLVSFSAAQNVAAFMKPSHLAERIGQNPFTNEFFIWANLNVPFETSALFATRNAQRQLQTIGRELPAKVNPQLQKNDEGQLKWLEKTNLLVWQGLPIIAPYMKPVHEKAGDFLLAGTFVLSAGGPPAPSELWAQFKGRNDLVYYDWEFTGTRLAQWRMLSPLLPIFPMNRTNDFGVPAKANSRVPSAVVDRWLSGLIPALSPSKDNTGNGNVVTEVTRNSPNEVTVVRSSQLGFTAIELLMLSHWLSDTQPPEAPRPGAPVPSSQEHGLKKAGK